MQESGWLGSYSQCIEMLEVELELMEPNNNNNNNNNNSNNNLHFAFVDLEKAFDWVFRNTSR